MMVVAYVLTWILPQGFFDVVSLENGREQVVPGSFSYVEDRVQLTPFDFFVFIPKALASAQSIIIFLFIVGGALAIVRETGAIDALITTLLSKFGNKPQRLIMTTVFGFAVASAVIGASGEYIPFVLVIVALCRAMKLDAMTAVAMILVGMSIGYGAAVFNPYTVVVAQSLAGVPVYSGYEFRLVVFVPLVAIGIHHVWSYAKKVLNDPSHSLSDTATLPELSVSLELDTKLELRHQLILLGLVVVMLIAVWGISQRGWYLNELGALFFIWGLCSAVAGKISANRAADCFIEGVKDLASTAMLVGFARCIALIMEDGQILHTLVYAMSYPLSTVGSEIAVLGMFVMQSALNLFIPSGSGQAYVTVPLLVPVGDLVGINRQIVVLAYQFGDGFSNMVIPTNPIVMAILGIAGVPYTKWLRFSFPLLLKLMFAAGIILVGCVIFDFGVNVQPT